MTAIGVGIQELNGSNTCGSQGNNSLWSKATINTVGNLGFILTPSWGVKENKMLFFLKITWNSISKIYFYSIFKKQHLDPMLNY